MSKILLETKLKTMEGEDLTRKDMILTARQLIREALMAEPKVEVTPSIEMVACYNLQDKMKTGDCDFSLDELQLMKKWCALGWGKLIYPQLLKVIEG